MTLDFRKILDQAEAENQSRKSIHCVSRKYRLRRLRWIPIPPTGDDLFCYTLHGSFFAKFDTTTGSYTAKKLRGVDLRKILIDGVELASIEGPSIVGSSLEEIDRICFDLHVGHCLEVFLEVAE